VTLDADWSRFTERDYAEACSRLHRLGRWYVLRYQNAGADAWDQPRPGAWTLREIAEHVAGVTYYADQVVPWIEPRPGWPIPAGAGRLSAGSGPGPESLPTPARSGDETPGFRRGFLLGEWLTAWHSRAAAGDAARPPAVPTTGRSRRRLHPGQGGEHVLLQPPGGGLR